MKSRKRRILHVIAALEGGGAERQLQILANNTAPDIYRIAILFLHRGTGQYIFNEGIDLLQIPRGRKWNILSLWFRIYKAVKAYQPDIVHLWLPEILTIPAGFAAKRGDIPVVSSQRGSMRYCDSVGLWFRKRMQYIQHLLAMRMVTNFPPDGEPLLYKKLLVRKKGLIIPNAVSVTTDTKRELDQPINRDSFLICFAGRIIPSKRLDILLHSCIDLRKEGLDVSLAIFGEGGPALMNRLKQIVQESDAEEHILFLGYRSNWHALAQKADLFVLPTMAEGMPNVLFEAMRIGLPCIVTDLPEIRHWITHKREAWLVESGSQESLMMAIRELYTSSSLRGELADKGRQLACQFSTEEMVEAYERVYEEVLLGTGDDFTGRKLKNRVLLVGPCPKDEVTGARMGFQSLVDGFENSVFPFAVVDSALGGSSRRTGVFSLRRVWYSVLTVLSAWRKMFRSHTVYMTVSCSRLGFLRDFLIIWPARIFGKRLVLHLKGGGYRYFYEGQSKFWQTIIKRTLSQAAHIIVLGELLRKQFEFVPGIEKKIKVVPNGLPKGLRTDCYKKTLPDKGQKVRFLFLSNLLPSKGYLDLLEACAQLKREGFSDFVGDFCGAFIQTVVDQHYRSAEEQRKEFFERLSRLGLENRVVYHGTVRGEQKEELLRQAHIFIMPTYHPWEGQPISIIEAMAFATPVISTRNNGIPEEVIDGYNGLFVESQNPNDIVRAIKQIIADQSKYAEMSRNARMHFDKNFTRNMHLRRLMSLICGNAECV